MALKRIMGNQAANPKGLFGRFVGRMMGKNNLESNKWVVSKLEINKNDKILEIGFGPGTAIEEIFSRSKDVHISGIDISPLMVEQATKLNQSAASAGKLDLRLGEVSSMPWDSNHFDKVFAINVIYLWPNLQNVFEEIMRLLKANGIMAIYLAPVELMDKLGFSELENFTIHSQEDVENACKATGFANIDLISTELDGGTGICVVARK